MLIESPYAPRMLNQAANATIMVVAAVALVGVELGRAAFKGVRRR